MIINAINIKKSLLNAIPQVDIILDVPSFSIKRIYMMETGSLYHPIAMRNNTYSS